MFRMTDEAGGDDKLVCVVAGDPQVEYLQDIDDLDEFERLEIQHFFEVQDLGQEVRRGASWTGRAAAEAEIEASFARAREH